MWKTPLLPGRCLDYSLRHRLQGYGVMDEGGIICLPREEPEGSEEEGEVGEEEEQLENEIMVETVDEDNNAALEVEAREVLLEAGLKRL
jgi:hypothetical protein